MNEVVILLAKWKLADLSATDCGGDYVQPEKETEAASCFGCKWECLCRTNRDRSEQLKDALRKAGVEA